MRGGALRVAAVALATLSYASAFAPPAAIATRALLRTPATQRRCAARVGPLSMATNGGKGSKKPVGFKGFGSVPEQLQDRLPADSAGAACACHSGEMYAKCCEPFHSGSALPEQPLQLMRSRYSAYAYRLPRYIIATTHKDNTDWRPTTSKWERELAGFSDGFEFVGLEVVGEEAGKDENQHFVDFIARLRTRTDMPSDAPKGVKQVLRQVKMHGANDATNADFRERSEFLKEAGKWLYVNGDVEFDPKVTMDDVAPLEPSDGAEPTETWARQGLPRQAMKPTGPPSIRQAKQHGSGSTR
mmetsp:Transcript_65285/g.155691  ORF Transcript_65285/g.155691 Transcript_65285/m.155691 type:complete len:300 (+) Transcript_65285:64-963(+)